MNRTPNKLFLTLLLADSLFQCRREPGSPFPKTNSLSNPSIVTAQEAANLVMGGLQGSGSANARTASPATRSSKRIKNVRTLNDDEDNPLMHIIHFESERCRMPVS